ncbi:MAG TPA: helix-turn-helix transcriptional regulator [Sphingomicrobium sp.]|jgi:transcriptional regulator with XRE-family HTH domain|nr:helix-turn-helix transcriptional regulator [Sphingomicrobium sp.]
MSSKDADDPFKLRGTKAQRMLELGLREKQRAAGLTQRDIAEKLGYKSSVVLSHMSIGRVPIPVDKALDIAEALDLDRDAFVLAVLDQRYPDIEIHRLFNVTFSSERTAARLEAAAGCSLDDLPNETVTVLEEVVAARTPKRRWLTIAEAPVMDLVRRLRPRVSTDGLDNADAEAIEKALRRS